MASSGSGYAKCKALVDNRTAQHYNWIMIASFRSRALKRYWEKGETRKLPAQSVEHIKMILDRLDAAMGIGDLDLPGFGFHSLKGPRKGEFAVTVTRNWRITFGWHDGDAINVDLEDYH